MSSINVSIKSRTVALCRFAAAPTLLYLLSFILLTFPLITRFDQVYFTDRQDGYQMIWDLWWVRHAIVDLHQNPLATRYLHFPQGTSLLLHSLMPLNGVLSIPLAALFTDIQSFNLLVIFAFVASGVSAFWLCAWCTGEYWPSLAGGFSFAFCSYRWAHYLGHLPLISCEFLPLYLLGLLGLLTRPRMVTALVTPLFLLMALLLDPYQFFYCVLASGVILVWWVWNRRKVLRHTPKQPLLAFIGISLFLCGPLVMSMVREAARSPVLKTHDPDLFSADLLGPWVPDWTWVYGRLTRPIWQPIATGSYIEKGICLGPAVVIVAMFAIFPLRKRKPLKLGSVGLFAALAVIFILLAFGPVLRFWSMPITRWTPYWALTAIFPPLRWAGSTSRMIVMAQLALAVLMTAGVAKTRNIRSKSARSALIILFTFALVLESQPCVLLVCPPDVPKWVSVLRDAPGHGAVIDMIALGQQIDMYYQTVHHRPLAEGNVSRLSSDTARATQVVIRDVSSGRFDHLAAMGFEYLVTDPNGHALPLPIFYSDRAARVYVLSTPRSTRAIACSAGRPLAEAGRQMPRIGHGACGS